MIGKAYGIAKHSIGKLFHMGDHYLNIARSIGKSLTPFYHKSGLSSLPLVKDAVSTVKNALGDYDKLKQSLMSV